MKEPSGETILMEHDITVLYITAESYPDGIPTAHQALHKLIPFSKERSYYGLSRPENVEGIVYRAAATELTQGEAKALGCETLVLKKGAYAFTVIKDYLKDLSSIGQAFGSLLQHPQLDPQGYCVEWYFNATDVRCMVRIESK
jgi:hypothetical protein